MMDNKKIAVIISIFIVGFLAITAVMGLLSKLPFVGKAIALILAVILIIFVLSIFLISGRKKK